MKLIVKPIDPTQPGSYRERKQFLEVARRLDAVKDGKDIRDTLAAYDALEALMLPRLVTDDGSPIEDALDQLSANQFDELIADLSFGADAVPPVSASDSSSPSEVTETLPTG